MGGRRGKENQIILLLPHVHGRLNHIQHMRRETHKIWHCLLRHSNKQGMSLGYHRHSVAFELIEASRIHVFGEKKHRNNWLSPWDKVTPHRCVYSEVLILQHSCPRDMGQKCWSCNCQNLCWLYLRNLGSASWIYIIMGLGEFNPFLHVVPHTSFIHWQKMYT